MYIAGSWTPFQQNLITFVLIDSSGNEVAGLGDAFSLEISKAGGAFASGLGTKAEIGSGWYSYLATADEADTYGPVSVTADGVGTVQQNLEYVVGARMPGAVAFAYTVTSSDTLDPIEGVKVWVTTDLAGSNIVHANLFTDTFGVARHDNGSLPLLDIGTYYFWKRKANFVDDQNPDTEVVS